MALLGRRRDKSRGWEGRWSTHSIHVEWKLSHRKESFSISLWYSTYLAADMQAHIFERFLVCLWNHPQIQVSHVNSILLVPK